MRDVIVERMDHERLFGRFVEEAWEGEGIR